VISRGDIRWFRFGTPDKRRPVLVVDRSSVGPLIATLPPGRWPEVRAALLDVLGFDP